MTSRGIRAGGSVFALTALLVVGGAAYAESVIHVDWTGPDGGDGTTWASAFNDIHEALGSQLRLVANHEEARVVGQGSQCVDDVAPRLEGEIHTADVRTTGPLGKGNLEPSGNRELRQQAPTLQRFGGTGLQSKIPDGLGTPACSQPS